MSKLIIYLTIIGLFFASVFIFGFVKSTVKSDVIDVVVKNERVVSQGGDSAKYLVFGEKEVYENADSLWFWKWNSSDYYRDIKVNKKYKFTVVGWRVPFLSWYRNIVAFEEIK